MKSKKEIWQEIADELAALSPEEFKARLEQHANSDLIGIIEEHVKATQLELKHMPKY